VHLVARDAPFFEVRTDSQRNKKPRAGAGEMLDGSHVEMVVVIVRDKHGIDGRKC